MAMNLAETTLSYHKQLCPDLTTYWQLRHSPDSEGFFLRAKGLNLCHSFSSKEAFVLQHFNGKWTVDKIQKRSQKHFSGQVSSNFVEELLEKLVSLDIVVPASELEARGIQLKPCVEFILHPEGHWILRNPEDITHIQVCPRGKAIVEQLQAYSPEEIVKQGEFQPAEIKDILGQLRVTAMIAGTKPPQPPKKKFNPLQLLFFRVKLFNPDPYLLTPAKLLAWIWTKPFFLILCAFLSLSTVVGLNHRAHILLTGQILWQNYGATLIIPFGLLAVLVVTIHELGHALTLKHYNGIVPEVGLLFMFMMPAAYTNTSDSYCLVKRRQRVFVVGAGILTQLTVGGIAFWLWQISVESSWLYQSSYLLLIAALFTIAVNLNPLARFDGYHLLVALTGINNLRKRSFDYYRNLFTFTPTEEPKQTQPILAAYAPFSFAYIIFVFGSIFRLIIHWSLDNIPITAFLLLLAWAIYYFFPRQH
ncbi:MAG: hypothetical protein WA865_06740 [Spirulinaceae cyanobacterium]